ncbi:hypothetical protein B0H10DRAFT_2032949 [Mycena sp. CBHHK59/15]|nr:hypothetical protein B0H10DRAFT_2032949 [Mycena sp. CBHHK59/15]
MEYPSVVCFLLEQTPTCAIDYTTTPQAGLNGRVLGYPRAHILGGCSAHNAMFYTRSSADDFNRYADLTGDVGWSWDEIFPYFLKSEGFAWPIFEHHVLQAASSCRTNFRWLQSTIGGGERSTSATSYLAPKFIQRPNLHVLLHAQEIILSAGTVGTPHILMNSGIGDKKVLGALEIPTILDLPSVGQNVSDHPFISASWSVNSTQTLGSITQNATRFEEAFAQWNRTHTGPFVETGVTHIAWLRLDPDSPFLETIRIRPRAGGAPYRPNMGGFSTSGAVGNFMSMGLAVVSPVSRGSVTINSSNPFDPPLIDPGFAKAPVWQDYIIAPTQDLENITTDALNQFIRSTAIASSHLCGSAAMSARDARHGVVDPNLLVKGVDGLRIIDASILPIVPSAHTQAATYVVAERGADLVKGSWV